MTYPRMSPLHSQVAAHNPDVIMCPGGTVHTVRVYPPNETAAVLVPLSGLRVCAAQQPPATIEPVVPTSN